MKLYKHQEQSLEFFKDKSRAIDASDPGTGKTLVMIEYLRRTLKNERALIIAPKSILQPAWGNDLTKFAPEMEYQIAWAHNREKAFKYGAPLTITNTDAVTKLAQNPRWLDGFSHLIVDESTSYKNAQAQRSKAMAQIRTQFEDRKLLSGTFITTTVMDAWHQTYLVDDGERLGKSYWRLRNELCVPIRTNPHQDYPEWVDREEAPLLVAELLKDIMIRHKLNECTTLPDNHQYTVETPLTVPHARKYKALLNSSVLELEKVSAINKAVLHNKLLQCASGAIYGGDGYTVIDKTRYELVRDLVDARKTPSIVIFNWQHQKKEITRLLDAAKISHATIDGTVPGLERNKAIAKFQNGGLHCLLLHPRAAAHGLTLTAAGSIIWASPTSTPEEFTQMNARQLRLGQDKKTETILLCAPGTVEIGTYKMLQGRITKRDLFLGMIEKKAA